MGNICSHPPRSGGQEKNTDIVKCVNCGANMQFDPQQQTLYCEHCGSRFNIEKNRNIVTRDFRDHDCGSHGWHGEVNVLRCAGCGAKQAAEKSELSKVCPFCGASNIIVTEEIAGTKPGVLIPFKVSKEKCLDIVRGWLRGKVFAPSACKKNATETEIHGVYHPVWEFDCAASAPYALELVKSRTVTVGEGENRRVTTETYYEKVSGRAERFFKDLAVEAGPALDEKIFSQLGAFDKSSAVAYDEKYLSGFSANHYDKNIHEAFSAANEVIKREIERMIRSRYSDPIRNLDYTVYHDSVAYKYVLTPVWVGHFSYKGRNCNYYVNGSTGKVVGKLPVSAGKVFVAAGIIVAAFAVFGALRGLLPRSESGEDDSGFLRPIECRAERLETKGYELPGYRFVF